MTLSNNERRKDSLLAYFAGVGLFLAVTVLFAFLTVVAIVRGHLYTQPQFYAGFALVIAWFAASGGAVWWTRKHSPNRSRFVWSLTVFVGLFGCFLLTLWLRLGGVLAGVVFATASAYMLFLMTRLTFERIRKR